MVLIWPLGPSQGMEVPSSGGGHCEQGTVLRLGTPCYKETQ